MPRTNSIWVIYKILQGILKFKKVDNYFYSFFSGKMSNEKMRNEGFFGEKS